MVEGTISARAKRAHREAVSMGIAEVVGYLREAFGQKLVAYMANRSDERVVGKWAAGKQAPHPQAEERLRIAYRIFHMLQEKESPHTVRAWFVGLNPQLADESPATVIRKGQFRDAIVAANAFLAGG